MLRIRNHTIPGTPEKSSLLFTGGHGIMIENLRFQSVRQTAKELFAVSGDLLCVIVEQFCSSPMMSSAADCRWLFVSPGASLKFGKLRI